MKPNAEELAAARERTLPDVIARDLRVLFCGINPSLYSAATGHHFARPGNRFWPVLQRSGFTPRTFAPVEQHLLLESGLGITNLVARSTAAADELSPEELLAGRRRLAAKIRRFGPRAVAVLGIGAYRTAFARPRAVLGLQAESLGGALLWVLPNPSGRTAAYSLEDLSRLFAELREAVSKWSSPVVPGPG